MNRLNITKQNFNTMKKSLALIAAAMTLASCGEKNPFLSEWNTPYGIPPFNEIKVSHYVPAIKVGIEEQNAELEAIIKSTETPDFDNTIGAYELSGNTLSKVIGVLYNVSETDNSPELEAVMDEVTPMLTEHNDNIFMNKDFFARVKAVYEADQSGLTREQQMVLKKIYQAFVRNGVDLDAASQDSLRAINKRLAACQQKFGNNLLAENNAFKEQFGISVSAYTPEMTSNPDRALREKLFKAYSSRGNNGNDNDNKALCLEILKLRAQKANILGFDSFAAWQLDNKMAKDPQTVDSFLEKIMGPAVEKAKREIVEMQKVMNEDIAAGLLPAGSTIQPWDWFYYAEKVRKRMYDLDENLTKPYFMLENVRDGAFYAANKLYGISVEPLENVPVYNPEVKAFKVTEADGELIGIFLCDYLPRASKRGGAWMNNFRDQYVDAAGNDVRPIIVNVGNFTAPVDSLPSLLTIDEVQTTFHEFGHALHGLLSKCTYSEVSGTSVARDFVETFSQFNESWAFQKEILAEYAKHYKTGEVIPEYLVEKINNALKFNQGFMTTELCAASILDMRWHELTLEELENTDIASFEAKVCKEIGLIDEIIPRYRTTYFNHIFNSGYSAGYYSYLWAEVLDKDAFKYFEEKGLWNKEVATSFRKTFLEKGGSEEPMTLYRQFRGQDPDPNALLSARGLLD